MKAVCFEARGVSNRADTRLGIHFNTKNTGSHAYGLLPARSKTSYCLSSRARRITKKIQLKDTPNHAPFSSNNMCIGSPQSVQGQDLGHDGRCEGYREPAAPRHERPLGHERLRCFGESEWVVCLVMLFCVWLVMRWWWWW